jgi:hypothetical protein
VVRTAYEPGVHRITYLHERVAPVPAYVGKSANRPGGIAGEEERLGSMGDRPELAGLEQYIGPAETHPPGRENEVLLPGEDLR